MKKFFLITLGCKVNQCESEALAGCLTQLGMQLSDNIEEADVIVINTCTVTQTAGSKSRQTIRRCIRHKKQGALLAVVGCYVSVEKEQIEIIEGVDILLASQDKDLLPDEICRRFGIDPAGIPSCFYDSAISADVESNLRTRAYLKVEDGCEQFCTYCIVPYARGKVVSLPEEKAVEQLEELICAGYKEVVVTGIHLGMYGRDLGPEHNLSSLVRAIVQRAGNRIRVRLSSIEVTDITDEFIDLFAKHDNICPHLHIPLQSGSDRILDIMNRGYTSKEFIDIVAKIKAVRPETSFTTDIIVGFPNETDDDFMQTLQVTEKAAFSRAHVFRFSPRKGTPAADMEHQISGTVKEQRSQQLIARAEILAQQYHKSLIGETRHVLIETQSADGIAEGYSEDYVRVRITGMPKVIAGKSIINEIILVKIEDADTQEATGVVL